MYVLPPSEAPMTPEEAFKVWLNSGKITHTDCSMHEELQAAWLAAWYQGHVAGLEEAAEFIDNHCQMDASELRRRAAVGEQE